MAFGRKTQTATDVSHPLLFGWSAALANMWNTPLETLIGSVKTAPA
jgi:hypothetical protein